MPRNLRAAGIAIAAALLLALPASAVSAGGQDNAVRYTYVGGDTQAWVAGVVGRPHDTPAGPMAVATSVDVDPSRDSFTLHIDDYALPNGQKILVRVNGDGRSFFGGCVPVRSETKIAGVRPGGSVEIAIGQVYGQGACGPPVTAGVLTVRGLR